MGGVTWRVYGWVRRWRHLPGAVRVPHVRSIRSKVDQEAVSRDDPKAPVRSQSRSASPAAAGGAAQVCVTCGRRVSGCSPSAAPGWRTAPNCRETTDPSPGRKPEALIPHRPAAGSRGSPETRDGIVVYAGFRNDDAAAQSDVTDPDHRLISAPRLLPPQRNLMEKKRM